MEPLLKSKREIRDIEYTRFLRYAFTVIICFFWTCLCPHSHSKPIILFLRTISCQLSAPHFIFCLWNSQRVSASFRVNGTTRFADNKNHAVKKPRLNHIAGINTPESSRASKICAISHTPLYAYRLKKCGKTLLRYMNLKYRCGHAWTAIF